MLQIDMGYDISNYEEVHRPYGTVHDMDRLIEACHSRWVFRCPTKHVSLGGH